MSKQVFTQVIRGAHEWVKQAEEALDKAIAEHGPEKPVDWGTQTSYCLPMSYALMGLEVKTVGQLKPQVEHARELLRPVPSEQLWLPYLGDGLDAGQRFGMIKFGSRTELYLPVREGLRLRVKVGDTVRAGLTTIACRDDQPQTEEPSDDHAS